MMSVSPAIWNEIAATQRLKHPRIRELMKLDENQLPPRLDQIAADQESKGALPGATLAFATVLPLLLENEAISRYVQMKDNDSLRAALPEVISMDEAVSLATLEYRLTVPEQKNLESLLTEFAAPNSPS
jgi:hypothetical protein